MATEAGGPRFWIKALTADQTAFDAAMPQINNTDGLEATVAAAFGTAAWLPIAPALDQATVKFVSEWEDIRPLHSLFRTHDVEKMRGIESIDFNWGERDFASLAKMLASASTATVGAGASQAAQSILRLGTTRDYSPVYYHAAALLCNENILSTILFFMKVRIEDTFDFVLDNEVCKLPVKLKCFAWTDATAGREIMQAYEITAGKTG